MLSFILPSFQIGIKSSRKEFIPQGVNSFFKEQNPILEWPRHPGNKNDV